MVRTDLAVYRRIRKVHGGSVNDVVLATVTGALRGWLLARSESMAGVRQLKAVVPMSVIDDELEATSLGTQVAPHFVDLPIGEASPVVRLHQVTYSFQAHRETGRAVAANRLAGIAGFAPTTFHALGSRVAAAELHKGFHLSVTNVPGPQFPLYAAGAMMLETYPVHPLLPGHALAIGVTSYDGGVYYGLTADRDLLPDVDTLGECLTEALDELDESTGDARPRAPRGRGPQGRQEAGGPLVTVRVYVPTTLDGLAQLADDGELPASPDAVVAPDDDEETEYDAMMTAAGLARGTRPPRRRGRGGRRPRRTRAARPGGRRARRQRRTTPGPTTTWRGTPSPRSRWCSAACEVRRATEYSRPHGRDHHPARPGQRAQPQLRARHARARRADRGAGAAGAPPALAAGLRQRPAAQRRRRGDQGRAAARPPARARRDEELHDPRRRGRRQGRARRGADVAGDAVRRASARSSSRPPTCSPGRGGSGSTPRRCSASRRRPSRPRSTRPAS